MTTQDRLDELLDAVNRSDAHHGLILPFMAAAVELSSQLDKDRRQMAELREAVQRSIDAAFAVEASIERREAELTVMVDGLAQALIQTAIAEENNFTTGIAIPVVGQA
jgi:murein tripeptide amidase MpaA